MLQLKNISKIYGENHVVQNLSLTISSGMNFIVGPSGSGKSTLLQIMSGMDNEYMGEVYLNDKNIRELSERDKSSLYNNTFGFIWQDFNLLEDYTVLDNILLPMYLKSDLDVKQAKKLISDLKLTDLENKKVKFLSGGQKQRVAIARKLMKNPKFILADEPTSALDKQTSKSIMKILREISKDRTVIVVTHDTSHIMAKDTVFELDKGELISQKNIDETSNKEKLQINKTGLSFKNIASIIKTSILANKGRFFISAMSLMLGVCFLLTLVTDSIGSTSQSAFDEVFDMYGQQVLDIGLYNSFTGASGTDENSEDNPNVDVNQNIAGLYDKYKNDERVEFISYVETFDNINIEHDGKKYSIESSGNVPVINKLLAGRMCEQEGKEVVVPESLVKDMGLTPDQALKKTITFNGEARKWNNYDFTLIPVKTEVKIVGVIDANMISNYDGEKYEYPIEDSFFFSQSALIDLLKQSNNDINNLNIIMRAKTPEDMIAIKDELNRDGIVPIGLFEIIEDIVRLNTQSTDQSSSASIFILLLVLIMVAGISLITSILRRKEYAIFKICGFSNSNHRLLNLFESLMEMVFSFIIMIILSPLINIISERIFTMTIIRFEDMGINILLFLGLTVLSYIIREIVCERTSILKAFKTGGK